MGEGSLHEEEKNCQRRKIKIWLWATGRLTAGRNVTWNWTRVIALQITDPSSRQRGRPTWRKNEIVTQRNLKSGPDTKTNWQTDRRSQYNLNLKLRDCTANYRPVLSLERAPYMKKKETNCHAKKCNIWSIAPKGARHQDELADWPSVAI
jgi:hypothetical protein